MGTQLAQQICGWTFTSIFPLSSSAQAPPQGKRHNALSAEQADIMK